MAVFGGPKIVDDGLVLSIDPANIKSYPQSGTSLFNKKNYSQTTSLINGPSVSYDNQGEILLDGVNDYIVVNGSVTNQTLSPAQATFDI
jgi:hypothetical protein